MIFVDTGAWFALIVPTDPDHEAAVAWFDGNRDPVLTTNYVVETSRSWTGLRRRRGFFFMPGSHALHRHHLLVSEWIKQ